MIIGFVGKMGSGKTLCMTMLAYKYYKAGWPVFSNYNLNFPHKSLEYEKIIDLEDSTYQKSFMAIDEIHLFIDSRTSMRKSNRMASYFVVMNRKAGRMLAYTTQKWGQTDVRLRNNTDYIVKCKKLVSGKDTFIKLNMFDSDGKENRFTLRANPYFKLYDTKQILNPFEQHETASKQKIKVKRPRYYETEDETSSDAETD